MIYQSSPVKILSHALCLSELHFTPEIHVQEILIFIKHFYIYLDITGGDGKNVASHKLNNLKIYLLRGKIGWVKPLYKVENALALPELLIH